MRAAANANRFSETIHAVVVGVSTYAGSGLADLPECAPEAQELADVLSSSRTCGVPKGQVRLVPDRQASREAILAILQDVAAKATAMDILLFYFAGHGEASADGFTLRTGPRAVDAAHGLTREDVVVALGGTAARGVLVILDCCGGAGFAENAPDFFRTLGTRDFRLLVSASRAGESSWELPDRGSLFTRRLLRILWGDDALDRTGSIFFNDLFDYLKTHVVEDARRLLPKGRTQTPVFSGTHAGDPLLFLNRNLTLEQVQVRTKRITRQTLRRRVLATAAGLIGTAVMIATLYWAFLDSHQYLEIAGDRIALVHGYPGLTGFGMPRTEWIYGEGPPDLAENEAGPQQQKPLILSREGSPDDALAAVLRPPGRARVRLWAGDRTGARADLIAAARDRKPTTANELEFLPDLVTAGDADELDRIVRSAGPEDPIEPVLALMVLNPTRAIAAWRASRSALNGGANLSLMTRLRGTCDGSLQYWLDTALSHNAGAIGYVTAVRAVARMKGCRVSAANALSAPAQYIRDALYTLRLTDPGAAEGLQATLAGMLGTRDAAVRSRPEHGGRLAAFWRYSGGGACGDWLLEPAASLSEDGRLDAAVAAARDCPGTRIGAIVADGQLVIFARNAAGERRIAAYTLQNSLGAGVLRGVDALVDAQADGLDAALRAVLKATVIPEVRQAITRKLRALGSDGGDALAYSLPDAPQLDRDLLRWLSGTNPGRASAACADMILAGHVDSPLLETLALIQVEADDRRRLLAFAVTQGTLPRTMISVMLGSADDVAALLVAPDPEVRAHAQSYALARADRAEVFAAALRRSVHADAGLERGEMRVRRLAAIGADLATTPDFALDWRTEVLDTFEIDDAGLAVALQRLLGPLSGRQHGDRSPASR